MAQKTRNNIKKNSAPPPIYTLNKGAIKKSQQTDNRKKTAKNCTNLTKTKKLKTGWFVGLGDNLRGRRESVLKNDSPNLSTQPVFTVPAFSPPRYKALKASNHLLYNDNISNETLGFRSSNICLKSLIVIASGLASLSIALPDSKNSPISFNCAD
jgi:hypothetical protein